MNTAATKAQVHLTRTTSAYWRVTFDNPPLNLMGPQFVRELREVVSTVEQDPDVRVVVFDSAVDGVFLNHSDLRGSLDEMTSIPQGPTGLEAWPDILVRITRMPVVSIALIRGRATGNGSEISLACDMSFASRERALLSQWEVGGRESCKSTRPVYDMGRKDTGDAQSHYRDSIIGQPNVARCLT